MTATRTSIEWTDTTWNPVTGCTKVSAGCKNCYAETFAGRGIGSFSGGRKFTDVRTHPERLDEPLRWRKPRRVFVNSMSDLFHQDVPDEFIDRVFAVMALAPRHTFQVLTKRPARMQFYVAAMSPGGSIEAVVQRLEAAAQAMGISDEGQCQIANALYGSLGEGLNVGWPMRNVWLGVSCEDQRAADERIPLLLQTPAAVRFLSCEPLIGPIDLRGHRGDFLCDTAKFERDVEQACRDGYCTPSEMLAAVDRHRAERGGRSCIDWVIAGGESGPGARPCDVAWIRSIVGQCRAAGVACFVKQVGARPVVQHPMQVGALVDAPCVDRKGGNPDEWPQDLRVREFPR